MKTIVKIVKCVSLALVVSLVMTILPAGGVNANGNQPPTDIVLSNSSVLENQDGKTVVGTFSTTDPDAGDTFTYILVSGTGDDNNDSFYIDGFDNLRTIEEFDYETKSSYSIRVRSTDQGELWIEKDFEVTVIDVPENEPPISMIENMITQVKVLELPKGITNSLVQKLESSITSLERGQIMVAVNQLGAFVNEVNAQEGKKLSGDQVSGLMVNIFATAEVTARSLKDSGATASDVAQVLKNRFNLNALQVSRTLQNVGFSLSEVVQAIKDVFSATATKIAEILKDVYGLDLEAVTQWLEDLDYSPSGIAQALKDIFSATATKIAEILKEHFGLGFEEVAQRLMDLDYSPLGITQALKDVFSATKEGVARWFKETGLSDFSLSEIAQAIKDIFSTTANEMTQILHEIFELLPGEVVERLMELDYSPSGIAQALKDVLSATKEGVALWFKNAGFTAVQTAQALKDVFNTTASGVAQIIKDVFGVGETAAAQILKDVGFSFGVIVSALMNAFQIAWETAFAIVTAIFG